MSQVAAKTQHLTAGCVAQVEVRDGLEAVAQIAAGSEEQHLDCLIIDAGSGDASLPMSCPPPAFLQPQVSRSSLMHSVHALCSAWLASLHACVLTSWPPPAFLQLQVSTSCCWHEFARCLVRCLVSSNVLMTCLHGQVLLCSPHPSLRERVRGTPTPCSASTQLQRCSRRQSLALKLRCSCAQVLADMAAALTPQGLLAMNCVSRSEPAFQAAVAALQVSPALTTAGFA